MRAELEMCRVRTGGQCRPEADNHSQDNHDGAGIAGLASHRMENMTRYNSRDNHECDGVCGGTWCAVDAMLCSSDAANWRGSAMAAVGSAAAADAQIRCRQSRYLSAKLRTAFCIPRRPCSSRMLLVCLWCCGQMQPSRAYATFHPCTVSVLSQTTSSSTHNIPVAQIRSHAGCDDTAVATMLKWTSSTLHCAALHVRIRPVPAACC